MLVDHLRSTLAGIALTRTEIGSEQLRRKRLADLLLHQTGQELDIVLVGKTGACIDL